MHVHCLHSALGVLHTVPLAYGYNMLRVYTSLWLHSQICCLMFWHSMPTPFRLYGWFLYSAISTQRVYTDFLIVGVRGHICTFAGLDIRCNRKGWMCSEAFLLRLMGMSVHR